MHVNKLQVSSGSHKAKLSKYYYETKERRGGNTVTAHETCIMWEVVHREYANKSKYGISMLEYMWHQDSQ